MKGHIVVALALVVFWVLMNVVLGVSSTMASLLLVAAAVVFGLGAWRSRVVEGRDREPMA